MCKVWSWGVGVVAAVLLLQPQVTEAQGVARGPYGGYSRSWSNAGASQFGFRPFSVGLDDGGWVWGPPFQGIGYYGYAYPLPNRPAYPFSNSGYGYPNYAWMYVRPYTSPAFPNYRPSYAGAGLNEAFYPPAFPEETKPNAVRLTVLVPKADTQLFFDGYQTHQTGYKREFATEMAKGTTGVYHVKARWTENGIVHEETRHVHVHPGLREVIDFNQSLSGREKERGPNP